MHSLGIIISLSSFLMGLTLIARGASKRALAAFPLFYSYVTYAVLATLTLYFVYWWAPGWASRAYWFNYLINALAEFAVLVEISDHIFKPFVALRSLGRAITIFMSATLGLLYILPTILGSTGRSKALESFAMRTSVTKALILVVLFYVVRHYGSSLGRNVGGLMLGFALYVALNVSLLASASSYSPATFAKVYWVMSPIASALCLLVWSVSLWNEAPVPSMTAIVSAAGSRSPDVALELNRIDRELTKILHK
jgi:hypothetical protein